MDAYFVEMMLLPAKWNMPTMWTYWSLVKWAGYTMWDIDILDTLLLKGIS